METLIIYHQNIFHGFNIKLHLFIGQVDGEGPIDLDTLVMQFLDNLSIAFLLLWLTWSQKVWSSRNQKENYVFTKGWSFLVRNHYLQRAVNQSIACVTPYRLPAISFLSDTIFWPYSLFVFVISPSIFLGIIQCNSVQCTLTFCLLLLLCVKAELGKRREKAF